MLGKKMIASSLLLAGCFFGACASKKNEQGVSQDLLRFVSPGTQSLAGIRYPQLRASDAMRQLEQTDSVRQMDASLTALGIDPKKGIESVLITWNPTGPVCAVQGTLDASAIAGKLAPFGFRKRPGGRHELYANAKTAVSFPGKSVAVIGDTAAVEAALAQSEQPAEALPSQITTELNAVRPADQIWLVSRDGLPQAVNLLRPEIASALANISPSVLGSATGITVDSEAKALSILTARSDAGARRIHDGLLGGLALLRLTTRDPKTAAVLQTATVQGNERATTVRAQAPAALLMEWLNAATNAGELQR